jgi:hypothetical protein
MRIGRYSLRLPTLQVGVRDLMWGVVVASLLFAAYYGTPQAGPTYTGRELDLAICGRGYLPVAHQYTQMPAYVRYGRLTINACGQLCFGRPHDGWLVQPQITFPSDHQQLATFIGEEHLREIAPGIFEPSQQSGVATITNPAAHGSGLIQQGWLEHGAAPIMPSRLELNGTTAAYAVIAGLLLCIVVELRRLRLLQSVKSTSPAVLTAHFAESTSSAESRSSPSPPAPDSLHASVG